MERINYQIMSKKDQRGRYVPDYEYLIRNSSCQEEAEKWKEAQSDDLHFPFNMVLSMKQACGHWEIFQNPLISYERLGEDLRMFQEQSRERKCTRCICGWFEREE